MKRVLKKSTNKVLAGVCGGIADYYGWHPKPVRGVFILLGLAGGSGLVVSYEWDVLGLYAAGRYNFSLDDNADFYVDGWTVSTGLTINFGD